MPEYPYLLANGKTLVLTGDTPPSDQDVELAASQVGVRSLLRRVDQEAPKPELDMSRLPDPEGALSLGQLANAHPKVAAASALAGLPVAGVVGAAILHPAAALGVAQGAAGAYEGYHVGKRYGGVPGGVAGAVLGARFGGARWPSRLLGGVKAARAARSGGNLMKTARSAEHLVLTPEEAAKAAQLAKLAKLKAQEEGMRHAAYGARGVP